MATFTDLKRHLKSLEPHSDFSNLSASQVRALFTAKDVEFLIAHGEEFVDEDSTEYEGNTRIIVERMRTAKCHDNAACLVKLERGQMYSGVAMDDDNVWVVHSWVIARNGSLIETTRAFVAYFGIPMRVALRAGEEVLIPTYR